MYINQKKVLPWLMGMILFLAITIPSAAAADLDVGPGHTYNNITQALNAANTGDTINVYDNGGSPYVYTENVVMTKNNLSLIGKGNVTIQGIPVEDIELADTAVKMSSGSFLKNFTIIGSNFRGVLLAENTTVQNNNIKGSFTFGLRGPMATNVNIINNTITGSDNGIYLDSGNNAIISGNYISNNIVGINTQGMNYLNISKNIITNNQDRAIFYNAAYFGNMSENRIIGNAAGIQIVHGHNLVVHFNQITDNVAYGLSNEYSDSQHNGIVFAQNNWWGYNDQANVQSQIINVGNGSVIFDPWLILNVTSQTSKLEKNSPTVITADLTYNNQGEDTLALYGQYLPDGIPVTFTTTYGRLSPTTSNTLNGQAKTILATPKTRIATVSANVDNQTVTIQLKIKKTKFTEI